MKPLIFQVLAEELRIQWQEAQSLPLQSWEASEEMGWVHCQGQVEGYQGTLDEGIWTVRAGGGGRVSQLARG